MLIVELPCSTCDRPVTCMLPGRIAGANVCSLAQMRYPNWGEQMKLEVAASRQRQIRQMGAPAAAMLPTRKSRRSAVDSRRLEQPLNIMLGCAFPPSV